MMAEKTEQTMNAQPKLKVRYQNDIVKAMREESVSYTHLRAHETVLDLVCRLLLEKQLNSLPLLPNHYQ